MARRSWSSRRAPTWHEHRQPRHHDQAQLKLYLSSDKPLYQPGQTIHMRALALGAADSKPAAPAD